MNLFLSPHDDDNVLFGAFTCMREKPLVAVITDSYIQPARGEIGCDAEARAEETRQACNILGCAIVRLGIYDTVVSEQGIKFALQKFQGFDKVYAPAIVDGGNVHHNMVGAMALELFGDKVVFYTTYRANQLYMEGKIEVKPSTAELWMKKEALKCYQSQLTLNATRPHFEAVDGKSEWLL